MHQSDNPRHDNALQIIAVPPGGVLGYLPRSVAHHLAPLLKEGVLGSHARVLRLGKSNSAAIDILLEASLPLSRSPACKAPSTPLLCPEAFPSLVSVDFEPSCSSPYRENANVRNVH